MYLSPPITVLAILALGLATTVALLPATPDIAPAASELSPAGNQIDRTSALGWKK